MQDVKQGNKYIIIIIFSIADFYEHDFIYSVKHYVNLRRDEVRFPVVKETDIVLLTQPSKKNTVL